MYERKGPSSDIDKNLKLTAIASPTEGGYSKSEQLQPERDVQSPIVLWTVAATMVPRGTTSAVQYCVTQNRQNDNSNINTYLRIIGMRSL